MEFRISYPKAKVKGFVGTNGRGRCRLRPLEWRLPTLRLQASLLFGHQRLEDVLNLSNISCKIEVCFSSDSTQRINRRDYTLPPSSSFPAFNISASSSRGTREARPKLNLARSA